MRTLCLGLFAIALAGCTADPAVGDGEADVVAIDFANAARVEEDQLLFPASLISAELRAKIDAYDDARWFWQGADDVDAEPVIFVGGRQDGVTDDQGLIAPDANNPYGFIRRALSYKVKGNDIIIKTEDATLTDVLEELSARGSAAITSEYDYPVHDDTLFIDKSGLELWRQGDEFIRFPSLWVNVDPQLDLDLQLAYKKVNTAKIAIDADIESNLVVEARVSELPEQALRKVIYDQSYKLAPLGIIPVSLQVRLEVGCAKSGGKVEIEGGLHAKTHLYADIRYDAGKGVHKTGDGSIEPKLIGKKFHVVTGNQATLHCVVDPDIRLRYFGVTVGSLDLDAALDLDMTTPPHALRADVIAQGRAMGLFSKLAPELKDQDRALIDVERTLHDGPVP